MGAEAYEGGEDGRDEEVGVEGFEEGEEGEEVEVEGGFGWDVGGGVRGEGAGGKVRVC